MKLITKPTVSMEMYLHLSESEARALEALTGYGTDSFLEVFYKHMGRAYLMDYEDGLRSLFETIRKEVPPELARADKARKAFG